jgi:hypothetical protein
MTEGGRVDGGRGRVDGGRSRKDEGRSRDDGESTRGWRKGVRKEWHKRTTANVIPAKAGILTRGAIYKGRAVVGNSAGIRSRHIPKERCNDLWLYVCTLKALVRIRAVCKQRRPYPG